MAEEPTQAHLTQSIYSNRCLAAFHQPNSTQWQASALETAAISHLKLPAYHNIDQSTPLPQQYSSPALGNHHQGLLTAAFLPEKPKQLHTSLPGISTIESQGHYTRHARYGSPIHSPISAFMSSQTDPRRVGVLYSAVNQPALLGVYDSNAAREHLHPPYRTNDAISDRPMSMEALSTELVCFGMVSPVVP